ncbi:MAG TPA: Wzz/FepE/Etk N-terminal domain-containing protein, partial [Rhodothermales bacterium]|nr:Wzz/FepE/Etk N-terminal domain-containing protein [Rhodothermales bacterium]
MNQAPSQENRFWQTLAVLYLWRWFITGITVLVAIISVVIALFLPNVFTSSTSLLLPPASGAGGLAQALTGRGLGSVASSLLGGAGGDYTRYMGILGSRRVLEAVVQKYGLIKSYEIDYPEPGRNLEEAIKTFQDNLKIEVDEKLEYLVVSVTDKDPKKAADIANFMVAELNRISSEMFSANARNYRTYMERRYNKATAALDSLQNEMEAFQSRNGVIELPSQIEAFYTNVAQYRMEVAKAEIAAEALASQLGPDNAQVLASQQVYERSKQQLEDFMNGNDRMMQVSFDQLPGVGREYAKLYQGILAQGKILEALTPLYEQANFDEKRTTIAVQVLDKAVPSAKKSWPPRA